MHPRIPFPAPLYLQQSICIYIYMYIYIIVQLYLLLMRNCMRAKTLTTFFASLYFLIRVLLHLSLKLCFHCLSVWALSAERWMRNAECWLKTFVSCVSIWNFNAFYKASVSSYSHTHTNTHTCAHLESVFKLTHDENPIAVNCNNIIYYMWSACSSSRVRTS